MEQSFKELSKILSLKLTEVNNYQLQFEAQPLEYLEKFMVTYASKEGFSNQKDLLNRFISYMSDQRYCKLMPDFFGELEGLKIISCSECKSYSFDSESRAYCLYGKAASGFRRKTKEAQNQRAFLASQIENTIFQMLQDGAYPLSKYESHQIDDVLLNFSNQDSSIDPILLSNEVFSPFVPQPYALILIMPVPMPKYDHLVNFLKGSLLHIYIDQVNLLNKIVFKEIFYKNSTIKGVYFIDQGEVESTGGRIVARGWVTNGKCKSQGYGWKFKVLPFMKSITKNQHVWKQFVNDLVLNKEYPFKMSYLLGLNEDMDIYEIPDKRGRRGIKLPRIGNSSFDHGKLIQIEKMKHYDDRINEICEYKEKLFQKQSGNSTGKNLQRLAESYDEKTQRRMLMKQPTNPRPMLRYPSSSLASSSENILIMSVLRKLESLTEPKSPFNEEYLVQKREKMKISPAKLFQKSRVMKKKRYNS